MTIIMKIVATSLLTIIVIFSGLNCSPSVSMEEYNSLKSELSNAESQLAVLQGQLDEASQIEEQYQNLNTSFEELQKQYDEKNDELQKLKIEYDELNAMYEDLQEQADVEDKVFDEGEIDQAIFALINQERQNNGVEELEWGIHLYDQCMQNSREMADRGVFQYTEYAYTAQAVFMATKYGSIDRIAEATLTIWTNNDYRYRYTIINEQHIYGAIGTYRLGDTYYITYMVSLYK